MSPFCEIKNIKPNGFFRLFSFLFDQINHIGQ